MKSKPKKPSTSRFADWNDKTIEFEKCDSPKITTAYHEAGHAVMRVVLGESVKRASVIPQGDSLGQVLGNKLPESFRDEIEFGNVIDNTKALRRYVNQIMSLIAGGLAEKRQSKQRLNSAGCRSDLDRTYEFLFRVMPDNEARAFMRWLKLRAIRLLDNHWQEVDAVAKALLAERSLSGKRVREIIQEVYLIPAPTLISRRHNG